MLKKGARSQAYRHPELRNNSKRIERTAKRISPNLVNEKPVKYLPTGPSISITFYDINIFNVRDADY